MKLTVRPQDGCLKILWSTQESQERSIGLSGVFESLYESPGTTIPGDLDPSIENPGSLEKLPPIASRSVVTSVLDLELQVGSPGISLGSYVTQLDLMRPLSGELEGVVTLGARDWTLIDPQAHKEIRAGSQVSIRVRYAGIWVNLLPFGYIIEPPKFQLIEGSIGSLSIRLGDILALKRQSESDIEPYCGEIPKSTSQAAQIFARVRGLPGVWGGDALVENLNPDFIDGPPADFLKSLYEGLNYDVRTALDGTPIAVERPRFNPLTAIVVDSSQVIEGELDSPQSIPFSTVKGYNQFDRDMGFRQREENSTDYSNWAPGNTIPWYDSNNTYTTQKDLYLGDTVINQIRETWGYIPLNSTVPATSQTATTDPCGNPINPNPVEPTQTRLGIVEREITRINFEPHISGNYLINSQETQKEGWAVFTGSNGDKFLTFGPISASRLSYGHVATPAEGVCPQYWPLQRTYTERLDWNQISTDSQNPPNYQLVQKQTEAWSQSSVAIAEGQVLTWIAQKTSSTWDPQSRQWVGGSLPVEDGNPPLGSFVRSYKVPVSLEVSVRLPELIELFGDRKSKPIQFPNCFTQKELLKATERYAREVSGMAYAIHLKIDPRIPLKPGSQIIYKRGSLEIHGIAWSVETNISGPVATQSVILMRTFTEPSLYSFRNEGFIPNQIDSGNPCA